MLNDYLICGLNSLSSKKGIGKCVKPPANSVGALQTYTSVSLQDIPAQPGIWLEQSGSSKTLPL